MIPHMWKRLRRAPLPALGVFLFGAILAAALCWLNASYEQELRHYDEVYRTIPVEVTVTNLTGNKRDDLDAPSWVYEVFTGRGWYPNDLGGYLTNLKLKGSRTSTSGLVLTGITSPELDKSLLEENGGRITWLDGYDESILAQNDQFVCLISDKLEQTLLAQVDGGQPLTLTLDFEAQDTWQGQIYRYSCDLTVIGVYSNGSSGSAVYAPWNIVEKVYGALRAELSVDMLSGTLIDNTRLEELREDAANWFVEPTPTGVKVEWDYFLNVDYYPYALDIDDSLLVKAAATLENSIFINRICTLLVFVLSAGAGFFVGFLMVRQRKREIALMRTLGARNGSVYLSFTLEQMLYVVLGAFLGGAWFGWKPIGRLLIFVGIYFVGLTAALLVFLRQNLLTALKEDE